MENSDKTWATGRGNGRPLQCSDHENPMSGMKSQKKMIPEYKPHPTPKLLSVRYATGKEWRAITNSFRKNEAAGPKRKRHCVVDVSGGENEV